MITLEGKRYYTTLEFAQFVGVTKSYICRLVRVGRLQGILVGRQYLLPENVCESWEQLEHRERKDG